MSNPSVLKPYEFFKYPNLINMNMFDAWSQKRPSNHYIPDEFIQKHPRKFNIGTQKIIDIIKTQKIHPKSIDAILTNFTTIPVTIFYSIQIKNLNSNADDINKFIQKYHKFINWRVNSSQLSEDQKIKFKEIIDWDSLCYTRDLTSKILIECKDFLDWPRIEVCRTYTDIKVNVLL